MTLQQKAMELNMKLQLNDFIQDVNNNNIYLLLCPRRLAARARRGERIQTLLKTLFILFISTQIS
jgi:hypothetical protein